VIQGTLLVIPIGESLLYVRPLYLKASDGKIPELKRVIVAYQNQIVMADTLDVALTRIFGGGAGPNAAPTRPQTLQTSGVESNQATPTSAQGKLAAQARDHYQKAMQAQRDGNWALYGEEIRLLGEALEGLSR
jgi:uncharacterized membrane protein (UPF0182 family)